MLILYVPQISYLAERNLAMAVANVCSIGVFGMEFKKDPRYSLGMKKESSERSAKGFSMDKAFDPHLQEKPCLKCCSLTPCSQHR